LFFYDRLHIGGSMRKIEQEVRFSVKVCGTWFNQSPNVWLKPKAAKSFEEKLIKGSIVYEKHFKYPESLTVMGIQPIEIDENTVLIDNPYSEFADCIRATKYLAQKTGKILQLIFNGMTVKIVQDSDLKLIFCHYFIQLKNKNLVATVGPHPKALTKRQEKELAKQMQD
jgi:hypothetical protein